MSELGLNSLDKFEKQGNDYAAYDWYNAK
jgi:hypothetical protein